MKLFLVSVLVLVLLSSMASGQFDYSRYRRATLDTLDQHLASMLDGTSGYTISTGEAAYRVRVVYGETTRPITPAALEFLRTCHKLLGMKVNVEDLFQHELLVSDGHREYWLAVQEPLLPSFEAEVERDQEIDIFITCAGAYRSTLVYTINEFTTEVE